MENELDKKIFVLNNAQDHNVMARSYHYKRMTIREENKTDETQIIVVGL